MAIKQLNHLVLYFCLSTLIGLLVACGGQNESAAPPANTPPSEPTQAAAEAENNPAPTVAPATEEAAAVTSPSAQPETATTVQQAVALLDLSALPLPEGVEAMGQAEKGQLIYQAPVNVTEVIDFYRPLLTEQGWQESTDQSYIDTATATIYFTQADYKASLSASDSGDGQTMVTLMHHGNIDLTTLPQMADAEELFAAPNTLIYVSPSSVADVVSFTRQELAGQGWHEYTRPDTATADNADSQTLSFIQNGLELSSYITMAPAQDNKTSLQYSLSLLPLDLPTPADAAAVEFDRSQPYLSFQTPASLETLLEFYRGVMVDLGWTEVTDSASISPEAASLVFANEQDEMALALNLTAADGNTAATLQALDAAMLTETETTAEEVVTTETEASGAMPDLPFPEDARDVVYEADATQITFTSPSKIATLAEFYQQALPAQGWVEDADFSMVQEMFGSLEFSQADGASVSITLLPDVINEGTQVIIDVSGLAPAEEIATEPESTPAADAPSYTINDWPFPPEAFLVNRSGDELTYTIAQDLQTVADFYVPTFEKMELGTSCLEDVADYTSISCSASNGDYSLNFFAFTTGDNETEVEISFTNYALGPTDSGDTSGESEDSGPLTAVDQDGLPLPSNQSGYLSEGSEFSRRLTFTSPSDLQTLLEFYQTELAALGWTQSGEVSETAEATRLNFEGADGKLTVEMKPAGDETEVVLLSKNPTAAAEAGILPPAGQARLYMVNFSTEELTVTINNQAIKIAPEAGTTSPDDAPKLDLPPGTYQVTIQAGSNSSATEITLGVDEVWSLLLDPEGGAPLQMY